LSPLSYTTLPRAPQAFAGVTPNPALVKKILTGVSIDSALTLTTELPSGYGLKGAVKGDVGALVAVSAQDEEGNVYQASVDAQRRRYSVAVPAGVYSLKVVYKPALATFQGAPTLVFDASSPVSVQSDTNADIEIPKVAVFQVSGVVSGLSNQTGSAMVRFTGVEGRSGGEAFVSMDNSFSASLPSGSYVVSLAISLFGNYGRNRLAFYDIGRLTVSGADTQVNVELPAAFSVLGKVQITGMESIASESFVSVVDKAASFREAGTFLPDGWTSSLAISESGDYQGILPTGRELEVKVIVQLDGLEPSHLLFPVIARNITLSDNTRADFTLSAPPTLIPITGTVRSPEGSPVNDVVVSAFSESITAVDQAGALVSGRTNALGQFTLMVPAGSNYTITFSPPAP